MSDSAKHGIPDHQVLDLITQRWSPYSFADRPVSEEDVRAVFEAARWSASSFNEQPWVYFVATKNNPQEHEKILSCLMEGNQVWAKKAPVLGLGLCRTKFSRNDKPNRVALHDLGLANQNLTIEATRRGLYVHFMAGIVPDKAKVTFEVPDDVEVKVAFALGYLGDPNQLPEELQDRDRGSRARKPLSEIVFSGKWGQSY